MALPRDGADLKDIAQRVFDSMKSETRPMA